MSVVYNLQYRTKNRERRKSKGECGENAKGHDVTDWRRGAGVDEYTVQMNYVEILLPSGYDFLRVSNLTLWLLKRREASDEVRLLLAPHARAARARRLILTLTRVLLGLLQVRGDVLIRLLLLSSLVLLPSTPPPAAILQIGLAAFAATASAISASRDLPLRARAALVLALLPHVRLGRREVPEDRAARARHKLDGLPPLLSVPMGHRQREGRRLRRRDGRRKKLRVRLVV